MNFHANWVDLAFLVVLLYFILTNKGFLETVFEAGGFFGSLLLSYRFYPYVSSVLSSKFSLTKGIANGLGFFITWMVIESLLFLLISVTLARFFNDLMKTSYYKYLGYIAGFIQGIIIFLFLVNVVFALPVRGSIKQDILDSETGPYFVNASQSLELKIKQVFSDTVLETINFLSIEPKSGESLNLGMKLNLNQVNYDPDSENTMVALVNDERRKQGLVDLIVDNTLKADARAYAIEMMENGFFSHTSAVDGSSPGDRATKAGVNFQVLGENLAFAPDVYIAHQGLMNSPGHRANILSPDYHRIGIGVVDGGVYGRMFVQEFAD